MSERSFWSRSYKVIEKGANIFGFLSALIWIWALVFPGKAVSVLESYEARFSGVEQSIAQVEDNTNALLRQTDGIKDDTAALVAALPSGISMSGLVQNQNCPGSNSVTDGFSLWLNNEGRQVIPQLTLTAFTERGTVLYQDTQLFINAEDTTAVDIPGTVRPVHICLNAIDAQGQDRMSGFTIMRWRKTHDSCVANGRYGYVSHDGNALPIAEAATALCQ
ncbi:hypothetical protein ASD8599_00168 [Ascidiaceihabitans donghaensis]|uniref:Uncharacterized protein n=1 Tax=Ascidiaceihabitans donghaensis TaxID=1510460 RepID=A0A2R8B8S9_9RHOB|nr:hypothetical protein [Ascidiaceihabitans donghaensis]SPH19444.1 hypothetical protein ASD8599_00168 [Ascidiaceihabitans donghaensis]